MKGLFRRLTGADDAPFITVISGLPRSGTSMMMKMVEAGGIPPMTDALRVADEDNPKGYYEFERVKQMDKGDVAWVPEARGKAVGGVELELPAGSLFEARRFVLSFGREATAVSPPSLVEALRAETEEMAAAYRGAR